MMLRLLAGALALALALACLLASSADARHRHVRYHRGFVPTPQACQIIGGDFAPCAAHRSSRCAGAVYDNDGRTRCAGGRFPAPSPWEGRRRAPRQTHVRHVAPRNNASTPLWRSLGASLAGLPAELVAKIQEIAGACPGFRAISTFRPGAIVAGTHIRSLHGFHRAADIAGPNYACAYAHLQGWPGGYSTDSGRVQHIHLSWAPGSREWGARFVHGGGHRVHHARRGGRRHSG